MLLFIFGLILFFAVHSISIINDAWRDGMAQRLGPGTWRALHGLASLAGLLFAYMGLWDCEERPCCSVHTT